MLLAGLRLSAAALYCSMCWDGPQALFPWPALIPPRPLPPALPSPPGNPQSQLDFSSGLGSELLLEMGAGADPLGLLSPALLHRHPHQAAAAALRPGSGLSSGRPAPLMHASSGGASTLAVGRAFAAAYSQGPAASSVPGRRSEVGEASFLRSPGIGGTPRVPALFKSPEEQRAAPLQPRGAAHGAQQQRPEQRHPSLFSPAAFSMPGVRHRSAASPTAAAAASIARSSSQPAGAAAAAATAAGGSGGRNLVTVQSGRLESLDSYLAEVGAAWWAGVSTAHHGLWR